MLTTQPVQEAVCNQTTGISATAASSRLAKPGIWSSDTAVMDVADSFKKSRLERNDCLDMVFFSSI
jgi:hypothetical protein